MLTAVSLITIVVQTLHAQPPTIPSCNWRVDLRGMLLLIDFDLAPASSLNMSNSDLLTTFAANLSLVPPGKPPGTVYDYRLVPRNISAETDSKRLSYNLVPVVLAPGTTGRSVTVNIQQAGVNRRLLQSSFDIQNRTISIPTCYLTYSNLFLFNTQVYYHLFSLIYWLVSLYLIFVHPFFGNTRKSLRCTWVGYYAFYFQLISLLGQVSTFFYYETDLLLNYLHMASTRLVGLDFTSFAGYNDSKERFAVYLGKYSNVYNKVSNKFAWNYVADDPLVLCKQLPQVVIYLIAAILSVSGMKAIRPFFVSMRLSCTICFSVELTFRCVYTLAEFFRGTGSGPVDYVSMIFALIILPLPLFDVLILKLQARTLKEINNVWTGAKNKGTFYFDIVGYTGHKKYRDFYPFIIGEFELVYCMSILICAAGLNTIVQNSFLLFFSAAAFISVLVLKQQLIIKLLKLTMNGAIVVFFCLCFLIDANRAPSLDVAVTYGQSIFWIVNGMLCLNFIILLYRIYDLMIGAGSTSGENAKKIPAQKFPPVKETKTKEGKNDEKDKADDKGFDKSERSNLLCPNARC